MEKKEGVGRVVAREVFPDVVAPSAERVVKRHTVIALQTVYIRARCRRCRKHNKGWCK